MLNSVCNFAAAFSLLFFRDSNYTYVRLLDIFPRPLMFISYSLHIHIPNSVFLAQTAQHLQPISFYFSLGISKSTPLMCGLGDSQRFGGNLQTKFGAINTETPPLLNFTPYFSATLAVPNYIF